MFKNFMLISYFSNHPQLLKSKSECIQYHGKIHQFSVATDPEACLREIHFSYRCHANTDRERKRKENIWTLRIEEGCSYLGLPWIPLVLVKLNTNSSAVCFIPQSVLYFIPFRTEFRRTKLPKIWLAAKFFFRQKVLSAEIFSAGIQNMPN